MICVTAFYYDAKVGGPLTNLGTIPVGTAFQTGAANGINNAGVIVGFGTNTQNIGRAVRYFANGSAPQDIGLADPTQGSSANAVTNLGQIGGSSFIDFATPAQHAALFDNGGVQFENNLTTNAGNSSFINGLNDVGQAVGYGQVGVFGANHALIYTNGTPTDIGTLGTGVGLTADDAYGQAIDDAGTAVGYSQFTDPTGNYLTHAFVYQGGAIQDLNSLVEPGTTNDFATLQYALGINTSGAIVGYGVLPDGETRGFLLTPVPEPATLGLLAVGGLALLARRRMAAR